MLFGDVGDSGIYILCGELGERCMTRRFRAQRAEGVKPSSGQQRTGDSEICKAEEHYLRDGLLHAIECRCGVSGSSVGVSWSSHSPSALCSMW